MSNDRHELRGLMQPWPLTVNRFLEHAARWHPNREIHSYGAMGLIHRSYAEITLRAKRVSNALIAHRIRHEDRVATLCMNTVEHLEVWYGIVGVGAVCHTLNPRLFIDQLAFIIEHARDRIIFADAEFVGILAALLPRCPSLEMVVLLSSPATPISLSVPVVELDAWIAEHAPECTWGAFDEETPAGLCYTSGTTGDPKGVVYSHRSNFLHTLCAIQPDVMGLSVNDCVLPMVPMYHANAWALVYAAPAVGARLVLPGSQLDGASLWREIDSHDVTIGFGVPTVWQGILQHLTAKGIRPRTLKRGIVGGAACPERLMREFAALGVELNPCWGMTEMSPFGSASILTPELNELPFEEQLPWRVKQGRPPCCIDVEIFDASGKPVPHDGHSMGALRAKGPAVAAGYYRGERKQFADGYFDSGDVATIDELGFIQITDRAKDVIKSGGEWISSLALESIAGMHANAAQACVIGVPHPRWDERPVLFIKLHPGANANADEFRAFLTGRVAKWWIPEEVIFIDDLPTGPTGKPDKKKLRELYALRFAGRRNEESREHACK